jgi:hypothetical protein
MSALKAVARYHGNISHHPAALAFMGAQCSSRHQMLEDNPCSQRRIRRGFIEMTLAGNVLFTFTILSY